MDLNNDQIYEPFRALYQDAEGPDNYFKLRPQLAHYTTLKNIENIVRSNEIWLSNPLLMNDLQEVIWGIRYGLMIVRNSDLVRDALGSPERMEKFQLILEHHSINYEQNHLMDTYVFCLSKHDPSNADGILSMWRGYGENGNGVAIVFDGADSVETVGSPLIIAKVFYGTDGERLKWLEAKVIEFAAILGEHSVPTDKLYIPAYAIFDRIKQFALFSKHRGFEEEQEWRAVYMSDRDRAGLLTKMKHYHIGPRGVEPKLKIPFVPIPGLTSDDFSLEKVVSRILLGPSGASAMSYRSVARMLTVLGKPLLADRLQQSSIPFRSEAQFTI